jgi:hypothetical protein
LLALLDRKEAIPAANTERRGRVRRLYVVGAITLDDLRRVGVLTLDDLDRRQQ